ncbi:hypothetical protein Pcinc_024685 [Petrolisthes cinctipes]|uniref:Uncharacterized protein n=1 Tax=Petrolisthes cinctipes TaxID=88211 RepID=A0AAE1FAS0_PETCI|nr:hypothetical protein Pcinc_024685 [Petrolisthes cinctipes]
MFPSGGKRKSAVRKEGNVNLSRELSTGMPLPDFQALTNSLQSHGSEASTSAFSKAVTYPSSSLTMNQSLDPSFQQPLVYPSSQSFSHDSLQSSLFPTPQPLTLPSPQPLSSPSAYPHSPSLALISDTYQTPVLHSGPENSNVSLGWREQGYQSVPVNPSASLNVTPYPTCDPDQDTEGEGGAWGGEEWESEHTIQGPWASDSAVQSNAGVLSTPGSVTPGQPGTSFTPGSQQCRQRKLKMYQWPPQQDPKLEMMRLRALDRYNKRLQEEQQERDLNRSLIKGIEETGAYKKEVAKTMQNIQWYDQQLRQMKMILQSQGRSGTHQDNNDLMPGPSSMN